MAVIRRLRFIPKVTIMFAIVITIAVAVTYLLRQFSEISSTKIEISSNPDAVIAPYEIPKTEEASDFTGYFTNISNEPFFVITNFLLNWQNLFDLFSANPQT